MKRILQSGLLLANVAFFAGCNIISPKDNSTNSIEDIQGAVATTRYEAERGALEGSATINNNHANYSGTGFADGLYKSTGGVAWGASTGGSGSEPFGLKIRYSAGNGTCKMTLYIDRKYILTFNCPATANWDTWSDVVFNNISVPSNGSSNHTIRIATESASTSCINIDYIEISDATPQIPFNGPHNINGIVTLEAEDFDNGAQGYSYYDNDGINSGNSYRTNVGVDIEPCNAGGYNIGWFNAQEWMEYTCNVTAGRHNMKIYVAANDNSQHTLNIYQDNIWISMIMFNGTGGWQKWKAIEASITLSGRSSSVLRISSPEGGFNFDKIIFSKAEDQAPFNGPHNIVNGAVLQAEDFDYGGQNYGYNDNEATNNGGQYRTDVGVDIERRSAGGYNVGWINADEWLMYTCNAQAGRYTMEFYVAANDNKLHTINIYQDDRFVVMITFNGTSGWQNWTKVRAQVTLNSNPASKILIKTPDGGFNFDKINFYW